MGIIIGILMTLAGGAGTFMTLGYIEDDHRYTYKLPLTEHEQIVFMVLALFVIMAVVGVIATVMSAIKRNEENVKKLVAAMEEKDRLNDKI